jgi:hypothetical protein
MGFLRKLFGLPTAEQDLADEFIAAMKAQDEASAKIVVDKGEEEWDQFKCDIPLVDGSDILYRTDEWSALGAAMIKDPDAFGGIFAYVHQNLQTGRFLIYGQAFQGTEEEPDKRTLGILVDKFLSPVEMEKVLRMLCIKLWDQTGVDVLVGELHLNLQASGYYEGA